MEIIITRISRIIRSRVLISVPRALRCRIEAISPQARPRWEGILRVFLVSDGKWFKSCRAKQLTI
jgi:hypothetical protein